MKTTCELIVYNVPMGVCRGFFKKGEVVTLVDKNAPNGWLHVKGDDLEGYVAEAYVQEDKPKKKAKK